MKVAKGAHEGPRRRNTRLDLGVAAGKSLEHALPRPRRRNSPPLLGVAETPSREAGEAGPVNGNAPGGGWRRAVEGGKAGDSLGLSGRSLIFERRISGRHIHRPAHLLMQ